MIEPFWSCNALCGAHVGQRGLVAYAEGILRRNDTSNPPANRKMLSMKRSTSWLHRGSTRPWSGRSGHAEAGTGGPFICPKTTCLLNDARLRISSQRSFLARALAGEDGELSVLGRDVADQLLTRTVFPTPAPPNRPILPPFR